ncbi:uncharacterized protein K489DRAFT_366616 [Dissoconium aciculare CBS 342.82]|uniref:Uncharacterized protein n=1 Tax=Dissoconium aciculare CBS 342.82 TaxID=1314786 RepID=A0A6J3MHN8_9PEZI|nr:uncharacterized protein K489DRAFT_366616 [Dissoconium aciculare CBS 342.82]KAF1827471.1 hypothetical protein K489DRAFT_366616 [Dissoconium aciculare CBS 342.82]
MGSASTLRSCEHLTPSADVDVGELGLTGPSKPCGHVHRSSSITKGLVQMRNDKWRWSPLLGQPMTHEHEHLVSTDRSIITSLFEAATMLQDNGGLSPRNNASLAVASSVTELCPFVFLRYVWLGQAEWLENETRSL